MLQNKQWIASFNGITDIIMILDPDHMIVFANIAFCDFFGVNNPQEVIGRKCYSACHDLLERCDFCPAQKTLESGKIITIEKELRGETLKYWTYPVYDKKNLLSYIISYGRIVTDQKRIERELINSEKLKGIGQLAAGLAHEINNPLCSIIGYSQLIQESIPETDPMHELVIAIVESADQAKRIIDNLLEYSRQSVYSIKYYNIHDVITKILALTTFQQRVKKISVACDIENDLPKLKIDMQKTVQAFLDILLNGIEFSPKGGKILISAHRNDDNYVVVKLTDNGCGISSENIPNIFNPFFTTKEIGKGMGLGLSIALSIIEQQHGKIRVASEIGKGSTFEVLLPITV